MTTSDPFPLERFLDAQAPVYGQVLRELDSGRKTGHWMWFIFPQLRGLGMSPMAQKFGLASLQEARAYLAHPVLGERLVECTNLVIAAEGRPIGEILGDIDAMKFRSSMTLFEAADRNRLAFTLALDKFYGGNPDGLTLQKLKYAGSATG